MGFRIRRIVVATLGSLVLAMSVGLAHAQAPRSTALVVAEDVVPQTFDPTQWRVSSSASFDSSRANEAWLIP